MMRASGRGYEPSSVPDPAGGGALLARGASSSSRALGLRVEVLISGRGRALGSGLPGPSWFLAFIVAAVAARDCIEVRWAIERCRRCPRRRAPSLPRHNASNSAEAPQGRGEGGSADRVRAPGALAGSGRNYRGSYRMWGRVARLCSPWLGRRDAGCFFADSGVWVECRGGRGAGECAGGRKAGATCPLVLVGLASGASHLYSSPDASITTLSLRLNGGAAGAAIVDPVLPWLFAAPAFKHSAGSLSLVVRCFPELREVGSLSGLWCVTFVLCCLILRNMRIVTFLPPRGYHG